ncbi:MAG TPA: hypothetical protein VG013_37380 [Gemmataceae bacterium]|jgi:hypothetical protein|nr:hypothetical protein [Gemmataceae bacterium]
MAKKQPNGHLPRPVARRILERCARGERAVVVVIKNGKPSSVWGFNEYLQRKESAKKVKPWQHRKAKAAVPDPLGAVDAGVLAPLTRANMTSDYE